MKKKKNIQCDIHEENKRRREEINNQKQQKILPNQLKLKNILEKKKEHYNINITNNASKSIRKYNE